LRRKRVAPLLVTVVVFLLTLGSAAPAQAVAYAQIEGSGSSWSEVIVQQWISDVDAYGMKVTYQGSGSSQGRKDFAANVTDFGISEIPYQGSDEFGNADNSNGRAFAYLPIVAGGTAFTYQLRIGGKQVNNLRLSGATVAKIFTNQITNWSDPAIKADNNGRILPSLPITPVVRSDGSGTTAQFTAYLDHEYPSIWRPFYGRSGMTSYFPRRGRAIAASKSDQVMNTISSAAGNGTIGYVEYSYPLNAAYPVVKVLNRGGYFVEPTQYNVAVALTKARINQDKTSQNYLTQILTGVYTASDPRAYPLSSYSYMLIPTGSKDVRMTTAKRQTLADFMFYSLCQGQTKAGGYGYSPLPLNLVQAGFEQLGKLKVADPAIDIKNRDVRSCNNPTFNGRDLGTNRLAQVAPAPATCDKVGQGPCGSPTGKGVPTTNQSESRNGGAAAAVTGKTGAAAPGTTGGSGPATAGAPRAAAGSAPPGGAAPAASGGAGAQTVDPATGEVVAAAASGDASGADVMAVPTQLVASREDDTSVFATLAALELLLLVLLPGFLAMSRSRRGSGGSR